MQPQPRRVLIIGGGPCGLVSLRNLTEQGNFESVELVERRDDVGGVWHLDNPGSLNDVHDRPRWPSPAYPGMIGNVLPEYLSFSQHPFLSRPSTIQPFPTLAETQAYLREFAEPYITNGKLRLNTEVVSVDEGGVGDWRVVVKDWSTEGRGREIKERWDAVVVATGWFDNPLWPDIDGLDELREKGFAKHAKDYMGPAGCEGKRVVVIGNGNSSNDIAAQVVALAHPPVYRSIRHPPIFRFVCLPDPNITDVAPAVRFTLNHTPEGEKATVHLKDGSEIPDVDTIFFGTGYTHGFPFLRVLDPPGSGADSSSSSNTQTLIPLVPPTTRPTRIPFLHRQIIYAHNPSLAFIGAIMCLTPFIMADLCSTFLALAWSSPPLPYPDTAAARSVDDAERVELVRRLRGETDNPSNFIACHVLGDREQVYASGLREEVVRASQELDGVLADWSVEELAARDVMYPRKLEALRLARDGGLEA